MRRGNSAGLRGFDIVEQLVRNCARSLALVIAMVIMSGCNRPVESNWHEENGYRWRELSVKAGPAGFTSLSARATGIDFENDVSDSILVGNRILGQGAGVALGDVDGDGRPEVFLARTEGCNALFRNLGGMRFEDVTPASGLGACDRHSTAAAFADVDSDGDLDLVLLATTGPNAIFLNDGSGKFIEHRDLGLDTVGRGGTTISMADVDGSGRLAMYIANYKPYNVDDTIPPQQRAFNQMVRQVAPGQYEVEPAHRRDYKLVMRPDMGGLRLTQRAESDEFYENDGKGHFSIVSLTSSRFRDASGNTLDAAPESFTLGAKFADLNGDGAPDLYVANDFEDTDMLWYNDGTGSFRLADWSAQRQMSNSTMAVDVADVNGDGLPDLYTVDMLANDSHKLKTQIPTNTALPKRPGDMQQQLQQQRNTLFINRGDGTFAEVSQFAGVSASGWSWSTMLMDVDLDGYEDILIGNGHLWDIMDADVQEGLQNRLNAVPWQRLRWEFPTLKRKNVALRNRGDLTFADASSEWHFGTEEDISHTMASADLDGDGDLDVVVNRLRSPSLVLRNDAGAPRIAVRLIGDAPNTRAVGAKISVINGAVPLQTHEVVVGGLYMSHSDYEASFAMGKEPSSNSTLIVDWRNGTRTTINDVRANREYEITTAAATIRADSAKPTSAYIGAPLFSDASVQLGSHKHVEDDFDDWDRQYLLPNALSQIGPGISWYDLDRDGNDELLVGTGKGGHIAVFNNVNGELRRTPVQGPSASLDYTSIIGFTDGGKTSVLAGVATWQSRSESEMIAQPAAVQIAVSGAVLSASAMSAVGSHESSTGPMAMADYNGDGSLDLFVGSRAIPLRYPVAPSSGLFIKVKDSFVFDTANAKLLEGVGMISSAMFADMNGDGSDDLVLAREWDSILLLLNDGHGKFAVAPDRWGLSKFRSRWNGVAAGDLDGDGKLDLLATSFGRNTTLHADSTRPLILVHGPFGARGEEEMLLAQRDSRLATMVPLNSYARVRLAFPAMARSVRTFAEYADASIEQVLGASIAQARRLSINTLDNVAFMNRGDHFDVVPLPEEAQLAPAFYAGIADFDGDGREDVFLGQNLSATVVGTPRFDAGRSLLLLNGASTYTKSNISSGNGVSLKAVDGAKSGLVIYGDQRGAGYSDFNGDGRVDLAVSQNGADTKLFINRNAKPGLRVRVNGPSRNPDGVGVQLRVVYGKRMGPVREIQSSAGYLSQNSAVQVFGLDGVPTAVWARWPGGKTVVVPVASGATEVIVR